MKNIIYCCIVVFLQTQLLAQKIEALSNTPGEAAVQAVNNTSGGIGVYGQGGLAGLSGFAILNGAYGVLGQTTFQVGAGVYGTGPGTGIYGFSGGSFGIGVKGEGNGNGGRGVYGSTNQTSGFGVYGASSAAGASAIFGDAQNGFAIFGQSSGNGWAGYFTGGKGVFIETKLGVNTQTPEYPIQVGNFDGAPGNGAHVTVGGTWTNSSSKTLKEDFLPVDPQQILNKVNQLPITKWQYRNSDEGTHMGPMAEDFYASFQLGYDERYISSLDADGVALAAIQALSAKINQQEQLIRKQQDSIEMLLRHSRFARKNNRNIKPRG